MSCCDSNENAENASSYGVSHKKKIRDPEKVKSLVSRLNRIAGQVNGIKRMVEENAYCPDILVQASAVTAALNSFNKVLLEDHVKSCVAEGIRAGKDDVVDELMTVLQKLMK